jgi:hypothetical protein
MQRGGPLPDALDDAIWLFRGVPVESTEVNDVRMDGTIHPPRPDRVGDIWRHRHMMLNDTETGYTSWTTDRGLAVDAAYFSASVPGLSGQVAIFRVRVESLPAESVYPGRDDENEYLIEGIVDGVSISVSESDDEEQAHG